MKCTSSFFKWHGTTCHLIWILLFGVSSFNQLVWCRQHNNKLNHKRLKFELDIKQGCDAIGFPNATLNQCGFCVGGGTDLPLDYGKDCKGVCFGNATFDCQGVCEGNAYIDECTGVCLNYDQYLSQVWNTSTNRDCQGMCVGGGGGGLTSSVPMPSHTYSLDQCGICRLSSSTASTGFSSSSSQSSNSVDCNANCQLPGLSKSNIVCGQCVRQSELANVLDDCGNCLSEGHPCSCDRDPTKCGCIDPNNCYIIKTISPGAIPSQSWVNVSIVGYFYPYAKQLYCIVRRHGFDSMDSFLVHFLHKNKTVIECNMQLSQAGEYAVGLGFRKNVFITPPKDLLHLYVYDGSLVNISLLRPFKSLNNESNSLLSVEFVDENGMIPPIPIKCKVIYESGEVEISNVGIKPNSCTLKRSSLRSKSQKVKIYPTFDGSNIFPVYMEHLIEATAPKIFALSSFVSEDGLSIVVNFDKSVDLDAVERETKEHTDDNDEALVMCDYLLAESTIEHLSLYGLQGCQWATRVQLIITILRPLSTDSIEIEIKPQVLLEYNQKYALPNEAMVANISKLSTSLNWWSYEPMLTIIGPSQIPVCADFALIGLFSSPRSTHEVEFQWEVVGQVSGELKQYIARNGKSTNLILNSDMFESGLEYTFTLTAFISSRLQNLKAFHTFTKLEYTAPVVSIYHSRLLQTTPLYENENITLVADVSVPDCIYPPQRVILNWRVEDPKFLFPYDDLKKRFSIAYTIEPFNVPANHVTAIMADAFIGLFQNQTISASFQFEMMKSPLKGNLAEGVTKMTIGSQSGFVHLTSRNELRRRVIYQWSCHEIKSAQPCYFNFASVPANVAQHRDTILLDRTMQNQETILLDSNWFQPNQQYLIGLKLFDANNSKVNSETEYTLVNVLQGIKPQVSIGPVYIQEKYVVPYNNRFSTFLIPFGTNIVIRGRAFLNSGLKSVRWESNTFRYPLNWSIKRIDKQKIETQLYIHEDNLMAYGVYNFKLNACSEQGECSDSEISLMAVQSVTMCNLLVDSYVELELTLANVEKCNIAPSSSPVTFQLFLEDEHFPTLLPINSPQLSPVMRFPGTPAFQENQLTRLAVRVCDQFDTCTLHYSQPIGVENSSNLTSSIDQLTYRARRMQKIGDPINAISMLNSVFLKPDTFNESYRAYEAAINVTIDCAVDALQMPSLLLAKGHYEVIINALSFALTKTENFHLRRKLLASIIRFYDKAEATQSMPSLSSARVAYSNVMNAFVSRNEQDHRLNSSTLTDSQYLREIRITFNKIKKAAASKLPLGSRLVLVAEKLDDRYLDSEGLPVRLHTAITEIIHMNNVFDVDLRARLNVNQTVTARVQFGEEIKQNLSMGWDCKQTLPCNNVVYSVTIFPNENPFPRAKQTHRLSPVIDITIHAPNSGEEQSITGLFKATIFELTVTGNITYGGPDYATKCHFFDEVQQQWKMDDIHPLGVAYNQVGCLSGHLSSFVVLRTIVGFNFDYILGLMVAGLMGVLIFGIMVVFYVQRTKENAAEVTPEVTNKAPATTTSMSHGQKKEFTKQSLKPRIRPIESDTEVQTRTILVTD